MTKCDECGTAFGFHARTCSIDGALVRAPRPPETVHLDPDRRYCAHSSEFPSACDPRLNPAVAQSGSDHARPERIVRPTPADCEMIVNRADLRALVIAARTVAFVDWFELTDERGDMIRALDKASEAFADRFDWDDQPKPEAPSDPAVDGVEAMLVEDLPNWSAAHRERTRDLAERIVAGLRDQGVVQ